MDPRQLLIVGDAPALLNDLFSWLGPEGVGLTAAATFPFAKAQLRTEPDLVITQLKLGEYNGLHLALRARCQHIPTIVIGEADTVLERDAEQLGITYVRTNELTRERTLALVEDLIRSTLADAHDGGHTPWIGDPLRAAAGCADAFRARVN